jgi:hypothetical protein
VQDTHFLTLKSGSWPPKPPNKEITRHALGIMGGLNPTHAARGGVSSKGRPRERPLPMEDSLSAFGLVGMRF